MEEMAGQEFHHWSRILTSPSEHRIKILDRYTNKTREMIMMASNNYLGLTTHPAVVEASQKALEKYGAGAGSVPLLGGTLDLHKELEYKLAKMKGCEDAIIFTSGYSSNVGCVSALVRKGDVAINDRLNHASIIDGCRLSGGTLRTFKHNDLENLEKVLQSTEEQGLLGKLIIMDGVFSMDGDITNLPAIKEIAAKYDARIMIDEAHATGVIGENGQGTPEHFKMEGQVDIVAGTLSKALAVVGGFVASSKEVVNYLRFYARSNMFSTALPPASTGALIAGVDVISKEPALRAKLWYNINYMISNLKKLGFDLGNAETAIIPIIVGDEEKLQLMSREVHEAGIFVNSVYYPAVPKKLSRLRLSLMATHTQEDLDDTLEVMARVGKKYGLI
ncbi:MAG TPA: 8-amino-7-oxononanoate synthase [Firmicutes bacterium]|nr:8-amino-7-oxononanoate synthase [Bacillota bacterium]HBK69429.1 8-amino-7-oxononanoate synthase [Bacillota bacterium]HBT17703.1 8-amino-7-oxononanoate synthase [Bacillota bacterium]